MGALQDRITADSRTALKSGEKDRLGVLRLLIHGFQQEQMRVGREGLNEDEELSILQKAVKMRKEAVALAREHGREDIEARETAEIEVIKAYLPSMFSPEELAGKVAELGAEIGYESPKDTGRFMKEWMSRHKGRADGNDVTQALRNL
ncbi:MAG: GatB/YqeY domain-containing protein [Planctomycetota bacterium]|jgi:hypothetical protein|nr:GatB/YqeY domain-containing protein [Planctomycetota bacterium]